MDILLVNAPYTVKIRPLCERIGLGYIAAVLRRNGYRVTILDLPLMGMEIKKTVKHVRAGKYSLIGVSIPFEEEFPLALKLLRQLRKVDAGAHITVGGHFPTFAHASLLHDFNEIDSVVRGEGEYTMLNLASALESRADLRTIPGLSFREDGNVAINPPRPLVENLDSLPFPARDTLVYSLRQDGVASVVGSRGCYGNCSFCSVNAFYRSAPGKSWRGRTTQNILSEIETLIEGWGVKEIGFEDDNFFGPGANGPQRAREIATGILERDWNISFNIFARADNVDRDLFAFLKRAGLKTVVIGIESGIQRDLDLYNKRTTVEKCKEAMAVIRDLNLEYIIGYILMHPYTTYAELVENVKVLNQFQPQEKSLLKRWLNLNWLIPYEGTPIRKKLTREGKIKGSYLSYRLHFDDRKVRTAYLIFHFMRTASALIQKVKNRILHK